MTLRAASSLGGSYQYAGNFSYASLPTAANYSGYIARATDIGSAPGMLVISDGASWVPMGLQTLARGAIPVGLGPTGTMANNGAVTFGTAIPAIYAAAYIHYPLNAIVAGSAAGFYYTVMSSTTVGQVFNNTYTSGIPTIPASPTAFATTGPGAFAGVTTRQTLITLTLPGTLMGTNGTTEIESGWSENSTVNNKTVFVSFGGNDVLSNARASETAFHDLRVIQNRASASSQVTHGGAGGGSGGWGTFAAGPTYWNVNTAADVTLTLAGQKATATDWMGVEAFRVKVWS